MANHRFTLPVGEWPEAARDAWRRSATKHARTRRAYGRLLFWYRENGIPLTTLPTPELIEALFEALRAAHSETAALAYIEYLFYAMRIVEPEGNWTWLRHFFLERRPSRKPVERVRRQRVVTVPFEAWPVEHQARWQAAIRRNPVDDEFAEHGAAAHLRDTTRAQMVRHYGRWLHSMRQAGLPDGVSPEAVRHYVREMQSSGLAVSTIAINVHGLYCIIRVIEPDRDWRWLRKTSDNLKAHARKAPKRKFGRLVDPAELVVLGHELMAQARRLRPDDHAAAILFRDGLILCVLAASPVRLRTITLTEIGVHLLLGAREAWLKYGPDDLKEHRTDERLLPSELRALIDEYLGTYRPRLLRQPDCKVLWIGDHGGPMTKQRIREMVGDRTEAAFGRRITPHRVRDSVATLIRERYPEESEIAMLVLHHTSREMTRAYQQEARKVIAQRKALQALDAHEAALRRRLRQKNDPAVRRSRSVERTLEDIRRRRFARNVPSNGSSAEKLAPVQPD